MSSIDEIIIIANDGVAYTLKEVIKDALKDPELMVELDKYVGEIIQEYETQIRIKKGQ